jgi:hypothetical protein
MRTALKIIKPDALRMNKTESAFEARLSLLHKTGDIAWYMYEALKLRLGNKCFYTPDFITITQDGQLEAYEVKGFWRDDARVKIKTAANMYPWIRFIAVQRIKGSWKQEIL